MYRSIVSALLYVSFVAVKAQENTNVTYIKIQPLVQQSNTQDEPHTEDLPLNVPVSLANEHIEDLTTEDQLETTTEIVTTTTKKPERTRKGFRSNPRFISKLSYYNANSEDTNNIIEKLSKRRFKSKCRCAKIWNCPKLQISVPRCPNEYFMCCF